MLRNGGKKKRKNKEGRSLMLFAFLKNCFSFSFEAVWKFRLVTVKLNK